MRKHRSIDHARLWGNAYNGFLSKAFLKIAHEYSLPMFDEVALPKSLTFFEALQYLAKTHGFKPISVDKRFERLFLKTPVLARDRKSNKPVLLIPDGAYEYRVIDDAGIDCYVVSIKKIPEQFDNFVQLYFINTNDKDANYLPTLTNLLYPSFRIFMMSLVVCGVVSIFLIVTLLGFDYRSHNQLSLMMMIVVSAVISGVAVFTLRSLVQKNYALVVVLFCHDLFRTFHALTESDQLVARYLHIEAVLRRYFFDSFKMWVALLALLSILVMSYFVDPLFVLMLIFGFSMLIGASHLIALKRYDVELYKTTTKAQVNDWLLRSQDSFLMAHGLDAFSHIIARLQKSQEQFAKASLDAWHVSNLVRCTYLLFPLCVLIFVASFHLIGAEDILSWQRALWVVLSIIAGICLAYVGEHSHSWWFHTKLDGLITTQSDVARYVQPANLVGAIEFCNISFAYEETGQVIFKGFNLVIPAGKLSAIVGPSGSGKTTLLNIMMGNLTPDIGQVIFDGHDARSLDKEALRKHFGAVLEHASLFAGSIYDNIICGRSLSDDAVRDVLLSHEIFDNLLDLPMGLSTYIFDRGKNLSHRDRLLILLARALVHKPQFIFIDEMLSSLDACEQKSILDYVASLGITAVVTSSKRPDAFLGAEVIIDAKHQQNLSKPTIIAL